MTEKAVFGGGTIWAARRMEAGKPYRHYWLHPVTQKDCADSVGGPLCRSDVIALVIL